MKVKKVKKAVEYNKNVVVEEERVRTEARAETTDSRG